MNRSILAGAALVLGMAIAAPMIAWSADQPAPQGDPQTAPVIPPMGGQGMMNGMPGRPGMGPMGGGPMGGPGMMGRMAGRDGGGGGMGHGWRQRWMAWRTQNMTPQQRCEERLARRAGIVAYTVAKLNLTQQQRPLWDKVEGALQSAGDKQRQLCATLKPPQERSSETVLDRMSRREQFLSAHLQALQQIEPAMQQFYQALTPEQKTVIDHPFRRG